MKGIHDLDAAILICFGVAGAMILLVISFVIYKCAKTNSYPDCSGDPESAKASAPCDTKKRASLQSQRSGFTQNRQSRTRSQLFHASKRLSAFLMIGSRAEEDEPTMPKTFVSAPPREDSLSEAVDTLSLAALGVMKIATGNFRPARQDELQISLGDQVSVYQTFTDGWCYGMNWNINVSGAFPLCSIPDLEVEDGIQVPVPAVGVLSRQELIDKQPLLQRRRSRSLRKGKKSLALESDTHSPVSPQTVTPVLDCDREQTNQSSADHHAIPSEVQSCTTTADIPEATSRS
ncbi:MAG: hypothetical protein SGCHY_001042 [Lobulomycetales sp.]